MGCVAHLTAQVQPQILSAKHGGKWGGSGDGACYSQWGEGVGGWGGQIPPYLSCHHFTRGKRGRTRSAFEERREEEKRGWWCGGQGGGGGGSGMRGGGRGVCRTCDPRNPPRILPPSSPPRAQTAGQGRGRVPHRSPVAPLTRGSQLQHSVAPLHGPQASPELNAPAALPAGEQRELNSGNYNQVRA